jgi:hypothetical protein
VPSPPLARTGQALRAAGLRRCAHTAFDELRDPAATLPDGRPLPADLLFAFTAQEARSAGALLDRLAPRPAASPKSPHSPAPPGSPPSGGNRLPELDDVHIGV